MQRIRYRIMIFFLIISLFIPFGVVFGINVDALYVWSSSIVTSESDPTEATDEQTR